LDITSVDPVRASSRTTSRMLGREGGGAADPGRTKTTPATPASSTARAAPPRARHEKRFTPKYHHWYEAVPLRLADERL
jgi:hypothetical protein